MTWIALLVFAGLAWFWADSLRAREQVLRRCTEACRRLNVQFLDDTVSRTRLRLARDGRGRLALERTYRFEFSASGADRWQGRITLLGQQVASMQMDHPGGVTILPEGPH